MPVLERIAKSNWQQDGAHGLYFLVVQKAGKWLITDRRFCRFGDPAFHDQHKGHAVSVGIKPSYF